MGNGRRVGWEGSLAPPTPDIRRRQLASRHAGHGEAGKKPFSLAVDRRFFDGFFSPPVQTARTEVRSTRSDLHDMRAAQESCFLFGAGLLRLINNGRHATGNEEHMLSSTLVTLESHEKEGALDGGSTSRLACFSP
ncbi:hypothetical protein NDU88_004870 [Pleurodeles waltl]|uniref:Uncharacterized protein n=1 Tax=Pleurodeles waltl TaxID=8319 RepID=A0AAV7UGH2_PLEWA|nr:hypothetical protein NDU88_004870 [Pleurodeles waltl]